MSILNWLLTWFFDMGACEVYYSFRKGQVAMLGVISDAIKNGGGIDLPLKDPERITPAEVERVKGYLVRVALARLGREFSDRNRSHLCEGALDVARDIIDVYGMCPETLQSYLDKASSPSANLKKRALQYARAHLHPRIKLRPRF